MEGNYAKANMAFNGRYLQGIFANLFSKAFTPSPRPSNCKQRVAAGGPETWVLKLRGGGGGLIP